jgi:hypothetical protein
VGSNPTLSARPKGQQKESAKHPVEVAVKPRLTVVFQRKRSLSFLPQVIVTSHAPTALLFMRCIIFVLLLMLVPAAARAATGSLIANTTEPLVGTSVTFTANVIPHDFVVMLDFGDGSPPLAVGPHFPVSVSHTYSTVGEFRATLSGVPITTVVVPIRVVLPAPRVPHGTIFSTVPLVSPVLAGDETNITVIYRVVTPDTDFVSNAPDLSAIVDLLDDHDRLVVRGDPVLIPYATFEGGGVQTAHIPFAVPSDARGRYHIRVYLRTPDLGGTVAEGDPAPLVVVGGPDPQPQVSAAIHANGSIEVGPMTGVGSTSGTTPSGAAQTSLNANASVGLLSPNYTFTAATTLNPTSLRIDPLFTLLPGMQPVSSPNAQQPTSNAPAGAGTPLPHYQDTLGPVTAQLPSLLFSGGESLRGLDSIVNTDGWIYQAALGYPTVASSTLGGQEGYLLNFGRPFSRSQDLNLTFLQNVDDPDTFVPTNGNQPVNSRAGGIEFDQTMFSHLTLMLGAAGSGASPEVGSGPTQTDSADKAALNLTSGPDSLNVEYHNFGPVFAAGNGVGATSDSAGGSAQANLSLSRLATLALNFSHDFARSAGSGSTQDGATFTLAMPQNFQITLTSGDDKTLATMSDSTSHNYVVTLAKTGTVSGFNLNGTLATVSDALDPSSAGVTRTGAVQYTIMHGVSNVSFGVNATANQVGVPSANFCESVVVSFPVGVGHVNANPAASATSFSASHGFQIMLNGSNTNQPGKTSDTRDAVFGALVSYHIGPHLSLGLNANTDRHTDNIVPSNTATANSLRVRMDVML